MVKNNKKPRLRFKGFTDEWEQRKLGELGKIETGNTPSTADNEFYCENGLPWITPTDIISNITEKTAKTLSVKGIKVARVMPENSILCTCIASIGKNTFSPVKCAFNQQINAISPNDNQDPYFMYTDSYNWSQTMKKGAGGLTFQIINKTEFSNIKTIVPLKQEQTQIGNFFYNLDNLITLHQRKYDKLLNVKKALLDKMFPKNSEKFPKIRFKGFFDAWEQRKLGELAQLITKGTTPLDKSNTGSINFIKIENINPDTGEIQTNNTISYEEHIGYLRRSQLLESDILFSIAGTLGRTAIVKNDILPANTNQALAIIRLKEGDLKYIITILRGKSVENFIKKNPTIGAQPNLSLEQVSNLLINYPKNEEQTKIGNFFYNLDNLITLHQRKCEKLKNIKKALLDKMFV